MMPKKVKGNEAQSPLELNFGILPHLAYCGIYGERNRRIFNDQELSMESLNLNYRFVLLHVIGCP